MRVSKTTTTIKAPREIVWAAVTLPEHVRHWQYGSELTTDWIVGHPIRLARSGRVRLSSSGESPGFRAPFELRYTLFAPRPGLDDLPENYFTMTYVLDDVADGTRVTFIHEDPRELDTVAIDTDAENPVLAMLRVVAESLANV